MKPNNIQNCTHPVPPNPYGIIAMHCFDNVPLEEADLQRFIDGPVAASEPLYQEELKKVADFSVTSH